MNNTTFAIVAVMAAAALLIGAMVIAPAAYAGGGGGDGNSIYNQHAKQKVIASGSSLALGAQLQTICTTFVLANNCV